MKLALFFMAILIVPVSLFADEPKESSPQITPRIQIELGAGPASILSDAHTNAGNEFSLGGNLQLGPNHRIRLGVRGLVLSSGERSADPAVSGIHRRSLLLEAGFFIIPDRLYLVASGGLSGLGLDGTSGGGLIAQFSYGFAVGLEIFRFGQLGLGTQFDYNYTPSTSANGAGPIGNAIAALAGHVGVIPSASASSVQLLISYYFEK